MTPTETSFFEALANGDPAGAEAILTDAPEVASARNASGVSALLTTLYHGQHELAAHVHRALPALDVFEAAAVGDLRELRKRLGEDASRVDARAPDGFTALHLACFFGRLRAVNILIAAGSDPNAETQNTAALRPIHSAAASRDANTLAAILGAGADPDARQHGGFTALHAAAKHGDARMVALLLGHGADANITADDGSTAGEFAAAVDDNRLRALLLR